VAGPRSRKKVGGATGASQAVLPSFLRPALRRAAIPNSKRMWRTLPAVPVKRVSRFGVAYGLYLSIVWLFDYLYFPWLAIKFRLLVFFPLFASIFLVSWGGYYLYDYFREDVFFTERINNWLERGNSRGLTGKIKTLISRNPEYVFAAIATWWGPLHAYFFFQRDEPFRLAAFVKALAKGSFFCALFWGVIAESLLLSWDLAKWVLH
jgi:hypothetical protein